MNDLSFEVPKVLFQTSPKQLPRYVVDINMKYCPKWEYKHFDDQGIYSFFEENPLEEFKEIRSRFDSFSNGAHRADLFRYFYLYQKGGVYLDSDAVLCADIDRICANYDFISIRSYHKDKKLLFNGFIVARPGCSVLYDALKNIYEMDDELLKSDYHLICKNLFSFVNECKGISVKIYKEERSSEFLPGVRTYSGEKVLIVIHYCYLKKVPRFSGRLFSFLYGVIFKVKFLYKIYYRLSLKFNV